MVVNPYHYKIPSSPADGQKLGEFEGENFCPSAHRAEGAAGAGSGSSLRQQGSKVRKIDSLIERFFLRTPSKKCFNFCGLCPPSGGEPLGGIVARRATIKSRNPDFRQKKFGF